MVEFSISSLDGLLLNSALLFIEVVKFGLMVGEIYDLAGDQLGDHMGLYPVSIESSQENLYLRGWRRQDAKPLRPVYLEWSKSARMEGQIPATIKQDVFTPIARSLRESAQCR